jgi:5-methylcytosine-specific restriction enzyme subunit McrC
MAPESIGLTRIAGRENHYVDEAGRRIYYATEHRPIAELPLDDIIIAGHPVLYDDVLPKGCVKIYLSEGKLVISAAHLVGVIPLNDQVGIDVATRVPVANLEHILKTSRHIPDALDLRLRPYGAYSDSNPSLIDVFTDALLASCEQIGARGLHRQYLPVTAVTSFPKGRILVGQTLQRLRARGVQHQVAATWHEQSVNTGPNRCLKFTIWLLARTYATAKTRRGVAQRLARLNSAFQLFDRVVMDVDREFEDDPFVREPETIPLLREYYRPAIHLARLILTNASLAFRSSKNLLRLPSLLLDLQTIFEQYLREVLKARVIAAGLRVLDGNLNPPAGAAKALLDDASNTLRNESYKATPDIVLEGREGAQQTTVPVIIEVKYRPMKTPDRTDLDQVITYGATYRAEKVVIAHPLIRDGAPGLTLLGQVGTMHVYDYSFNLDAADLFAEEHLFAERIRNLAA